MHEVDSMYRAGLVAHDRLRWEDFTLRAPLPIDGATADRLHGATILITGAGGSIGSALARTVATFRPATLVLLDRAEAGLAGLQADLVQSDHGAAPRFLLGDVGDAGQLREIFRKQRIEIVFHAAACKHVPLLESNPFAAASVNVLGTQRLFEAARDAGVEQFVLVSTDKAVGPASVLGVTKRIAELLVLCSATDQPASKILRLGNVLGSTGSVGPVFLSQIERGGPLLITHPEATRYFLAIDEAVHHLLRLLDVEASPALCIPDMGEPRRVEELAGFLVDRHAHPSHRIGFEYTGLRPGDKMQERLLGATEIGTPTAGRGLLRATGPLPSWATLQAQLAGIEDALRGRNLRALVDTLLAIVPEYGPSEALFAEMRQTVDEGIGQ